MTSDNNLMGRFNLDGIPPMPRGQPKIDVTFEIDTDGILNVSAIEKSTGKENKITITNDKGRLSADEIDRMLEEAERYKAEDEVNRQRVEAKNSLENFAYQVKSTIADEQTGNKIEAGEKATVEGKVNEILAWLEANQSAEKEEFEGKQQELERVAQPVFMKLASAEAAPASSGEAPSRAAGGGGAKIEEID
mmetsp:Transcript_4471/g.7307  ORF Transcript_4471/g.7307 Transcript_4471/m.7307 type:complete len:192 (+) Transcript_4471:1-576(+)